MNLITQFIELRYSHHYVFLNDINQLNTDFNDFLRILKKARKVKLKNKKNNKLLVKKRILLNCFVSIEKIIKSLENMNSIRYVNEDNVQY